MYYFFLFITLQYVFNFYHLITHCVTIVVQYDYKISNRMRPLSALE